MGGRVGWDRCGWLLVEKRSEPALRRSAARPRGWALVRTGWADQAGGHGCGGDDQRCARRACGLGCGVSGSDLSQRLCAESAGRCAGGVVHDGASGLSDPVAGDPGEDRHRISQSGGRLRRRQRHRGGAIRQGRPQDRGNAPVSGQTGGDRAGGSSCDRGGAGVRAGVHGDEEDRAGRCGVVRFHQGRPAGHLLLLLRLGRRFRSGVRQGVRLFSVPDEDLAERARVGQTAGDQERDRVRRVVQRIRLGHRSRRAAGDLRPSRPGSDPGVRPTLVVDPAATTHRARPRRGLLVGAVDAPDRDLTQPWCSTRRDGRAHSSRRW